jgi:hypothetical protein
MFLFANLVRLSQPGDEIIIEIGNRCDSELVEVILRRKGLNFPEPWVLEPPGKDDVTIEPLSARRHLGKRHSNLEGDARLLRQHAYGPDTLDDPDHLIEQLTDSFRLVLKVMIEFELAAGMRLIAVGELAATVRALPERLTTHPPFHVRHYIGGTACT